MDAELTDLKSLLTAGSESANAGVCKTLLFGGSGLDTHLADHFSISVVNCWISYKKLRASKKTRERLRNDIENIILL